jgi:hypothetical protein
MPRPRRPLTERWVSDIPQTLAERGNAVRERHKKWLSKALMIESALQYYLDAAERDGLETLPPFKITKPNVPVPMHSSSNGGK